LTSWLKTWTRPEESPIQSLDALDFEWSATYDTAQTVIEFGGDVSKTTSDAVRLTPCNQSMVGTVLQDRTAHAEGVAIETSFFWPPPPTGVGAGYTAPLVAWKETQITGLTTEPLTLRGYYSQSYRPEHHNFSENFLFEPALEPGIPPSRVAELDARNVRYIYVYWSGDHEPARIWTGDTNWNFRQLPAAPPPSGKP
jgi:hypothetical protein